MASGCGFARTCRVRGPVRLDGPTVNRSPAAFCSSIAESSGRSTASAVVVTDAENNLALALCSASYWQAYHLFLRCAALGGESGVDRHVDMNRLVRDNRERLCSHAEAPAHPSFCI